MCDKHGTRYNVDGWMGEPEDVVVSDVSQSQKVKCHVAPLAWESRRSQIHRDRGGGRGHGTRRSLGTEFQLIKTKMSGDGWR